jgi:hypothetical protein
MCAGQGKDGSFDPENCPLLRGLSEPMRQRRLQDAKFQACMSAYAERNGIDIPHSATPVRHDAAACLAEPPANDEALGGPLQRHQAKRRMAKR